MQERKLGGTGQPVSEICLGQMEENLAASALELNEDDMGRLHQASA